MKFTNVKQLIIKFMGGGLINFPTRFLRWVKINGDSDDSDGGGGGSDTDINQELIFLNQVSDLIYQTQGFIFDDDGEQSWACPISNYDESYSEGTTILGDKENADYAIWVDDGQENYYTIFLTEEEYNYLKNTVDVEREYFRDWTKNEFAFPITHALVYNSNANKIYMRSIAEYFNISGIQNPNNSDVIILGTDNCSILGPEFGDYDIFSAPQNNFPFTIPTEGVDSCFVFELYEHLTNIHDDTSISAILAAAQNCYQKIYKAWEDDKKEIYLVEIIAENSGFYTLYSKSKTNDWIE